MLQQTQVATVLRYYGPFLARFPTVEALASASLDDVLAHWAGLGYYARARNLHEAARRIVSDHRGRIPKTVKELSQLPGVGRYTAGAVASIAFGQPAPVVDGNVARVLARLFALRCDIKSAAGKAALWEQASRLLPRRGCGQFNQALMELGATVCLPSVPACDRCPVADCCRALADGLVNELPVRGAARPPRTVRMVALALSGGDRVLIRRRPAEGLWGGLWELPSAEIASRTDGRAAVAELLPASLRPFLRRFSRIGELTHRLTHRTVRFELYAGALNGGPPKGRLPADHRWLKLSRCHFPGPVRESGATGSLPARAPADQPPVAPTTRSRNGLLGLSSVQRKLLALAVSAC